jgi:SAM-dependent methyltransferase
VRGLEQIPWLYDAGLALLERTGLRRWRRRLCEDARGRVLDLGCGTGRNLPLLPAGTIGIDPVAEPLHRARRRAPAARLVQARAEALPFRAGAFDTVVSGLVFCSVDDPARGLGEVRRILAPGGSLRMLEHVRSERPRRARWQDRIQPVWTWVTGGCRPNRDTERTVARAGFAIEAATRRARGNMRRFVARPATTAHPVAGGCSDQVASLGPAPIQIVREPITLDDVRTIAGEQFGDMVKAVVDVSRGVMAIGGELHADEEAVLLDQGSGQADLWGINLYPDAPPAERVEFESMINVRPAQGNRSRSVEDALLQARIRDVVRRLVRE